MDKSTMTGWVAGIALLCGPAWAGDAAAATAKMVNAEGANVGTIALNQTPHGVLIRADLNGLPEGVHAFHIHGTGQCEPPFASAGGHFNPASHKHGLLVAEGKHAGDMPNITVPSSGALSIEVLNTEVTLEADAANTLFDADGSAFVIHEGPDDYTSDPAGAAGPRIACGVIEKE